MQAARSAVEAFQAGKAETQALHDQLTARLESLKQKFESGRSTIDTVEAELGRAEVAHNEAASSRRTAESRQQLADAALEDTQRKVKHMEESRARLQEERTTALAGQSRLEAQLQVLREAEESLAGYADGARFLLGAVRESRIRANGALSSVLDVPPELETAIGAALGDIVDAVLLHDDQVEEALRLLEGEEVGRAALLPVDGHTKKGIEPPADADLLGSAAGLIKSSPELAAAVNLVLGDTLVVRNRDAARRLIRNIPPQARVVTLRGEVFRGDGIIIAGRAAASSTLSRPRQRRELNEALAAVAARLAEIESSIAVSNLEQRSAQEEQAAREQEVRTARQLAEQSLVAEQKAALDLENVRRQFEWRKSQRAELYREMSEAEDEREHAVAVLKETADRMLLAQEEIRSAAHRLAALSPDEEQQTVAHWNMRLAVMEEALN
ncbi:MAG TPA: hypothetical protein VF758_04160, partial [Candidatus Acidoferrum sp.]